MQCCYVPGTAFEDLRKAVIADFDGSCSQNLKLFAKDGMMILVNMST